MKPNLHRVKRYLLALLFLATGAWTAWNGITEGMLNQSIRLAKRRVASKEAVAAGVVILAAGMCLVGVGVYIARNVDPTSSE